MTKKEQIIKLLQEMEVVETYKYSYRDIAKKTKVTAQYVGEVAKFNGLTRS